MWAFIISFFMIIRVGNIWLVFGTLGVEEELGHLRMSSSLNVAIYAVGYLMLIAPAIGFFAAPV
jgi:hypothetical protein